MAILKQAESAGYLFPYTVVWIQR